MKNIHGMKKEFQELIPDKNVCLLGLQGSRMNGYSERNDADWDYRGIFIEKNSKLLSLDWNIKKETIECGSSGDDEAEFVFHEIGKFFRLALKCNPSIISLLFLPEYNIKDDIGNQIVANRNIFLSEQYVRSAFGGYAMSQMLYIKRHNGNAQKGRQVRKHIKHCFRLFAQGRELLETGELTFPMKNAKKYIDIAHASIDDALALYEHEKKTFDSCVSVLPKESNRFLANELLLNIRKKNGGW